MKIEKRPQIQQPQQVNFNFESLEEKKKNLRERVAKEKQTGTFSFDLLTQEEKRLFSELVAEEREDDQPKFRSH